MPKHPNENSYFFLGSGSECACSFGLRIAFSELAGVRAVLQPRSPAGLTMKNTTDDDSALYLVYVLLIFAAIGAATWIAALVLIK
ncbi:MAG TPA: hypothetical protein VJU82_04090 [Acidobacteriaceae bacterium]|nr:hypothetical protein [Acidobacteriaceae bacterium]